MSYSPAKSTNVSGTLQSAATATGNGTNLGVLGYSSALITVTGTYSGLALVLEGTEDGSTWSTLTATQLGTNFITVSISANGVYQASVAGLQSIRARVSAIGSGSVTATAHAVSVPFAPRATDAHFADKLDYVNDSITTYAAGNYISTITSATTTTIASFPVIVTDMRVLGGTLGNVSVWDSTTGSGTNPIPAFSPDKGQVLIGSPAIFAVGCTVVTAAATILTVTWRPQ